MSRPPQCTRMPAHLSGVGLPAIANAVHLTRTARAMELGMRRVRQASAWMVIAASLIACATVGCGHGKIRSAEEYLAIIESASPRIAAESYAWGPIYEATERFEPRPRDVPRRARRPREN